MTNPRTTGSGAGVRESVTATAARPAHRSHHTDLPRELRRRRVASWRCEPLPDGRRDPADPQVQPLTAAELARSAPDSG
ncbi:MAG: hypothetical protein ACRDRR_18255 [Pseudonocardiaceae bacterium]